ncbi:unnamed protein product [Ixodes hexagonus]
MCLDLEQLADALAKRLCSEQRYVYFAFEDYDAHVVELCPENGTTTVLLSLLVQAAESSCEANGLLQGSSRTLYRASVLFQWNIDTGQYWVAKERPLQKLLRPSDDSQGWKASRDLVHRLQCHAWNPCPASCAVTVFTNKPVLRGTPLKMLWAPGFQMAITL